MMDPSLAWPDDDAGLDEEDRRHLHAAMAEADAEIDRGEGIPMHEILASLRA